MPEEKNDTIRTQLLEKLLSFYPEGADWKYDRGEIEEELMVHLDQMEVWKMLLEDKIAISEEQWLQQARGER